MSLKDQILSTPFLRELVPVSVPTWPDTDGKLFIRVLSALEHERYVSILARSQQDQNVCFQAEVTALVLVDEKGEKIFNSPEDVKKLADGDIEPVSVVCDAFTELLKRRNAAQKK